MFSAAIFFSNTTRLAEKENIHDNKPTQRARRKKLHTNVLNRPSFCNIQNPPSLELSLHKGAKAGVKVYFDLVSGRFMKLI